MGELIGSATKEKGGLLSSTQYKAIFSNINVGGSKVFSITLNKYAWNYLKIKIPFSQNLVSYKEAAFIIDVNSGKIWGSNIKNFDLECKCKTVNSKSTLYIKSAKNSATNYYLSAGIGFISEDEPAIEVLDDFPSDAVNVPID